MQMIGFRQLLVSESNFVIKKIWVKQVNYTTYKLITCLSKSFFNIKILTVIVKTFVKIQQTDKKILSHNKLISFVMVCKISLMLSIPF